MLELSLLFVGSAFLAGFLMFLAPCTFPLVPAFLAVLAGGRGNVINKRDLIKNTLFFCLGFSIVFVTLGLLAGSLTDALGPYLSIIKKTSGILIILFALMIMGFIRPYFFIGQKSMMIPRWLTPGTYRGSFLLGTIFSVGWSPCIGPIMASIILLAASDGSALVGAFLLLIFSLGFALPFILSAFFYHKLAKLVPQLNWVSKGFTILAGSMLLLLGTLLLFGNEGIILEYGTKLFYLLKLEFLFDYY